MPARFRPRPSYASVAATLALSLGLSGTAWAVNGPAPGTNSVGSSDIINQEVKGTDIKSLAVGNGKLAANAVTTAKVLDNSLSGADINESTLSLNVTGGPCPPGQFVRNLSSALALSCGPTGSNTALGIAALDSNTAGIGNSALGAGALANNTTGEFNSALGQGALLGNNTGFYNSAVGSLALSSNTNGTDNSALGRSALYSNITGHSNTALGRSALYSNTTGDYNTAVGQGALLSATGGFNTALGASAGINLTTGTNNIDIYNHGVAGESATIRIGQTGVQTRAFLAGVSGVTTNGAAVPVLVDGDGQLGVTSSSRRFKRDIRALAGASDRLMKLRPVSFRYRNRSSGLQYGLIAEQVARVYPNLVVDGADGRPDAVAYQQLPALLLNEAQRQRRVDDRRFERQAAQIAALRARLARLEK